MSDPLGNAEASPASVAISDPDALDALHASVVGDETIDKGYSSPLSNKAKAEFIRRHAGLKEGSLDLIQEYPLDEWLKSPDPRMILTGLFLADLQMEFFWKWMNGSTKTAPHRIWEAHAAAEYWFNTFQRENVFRVHGVELVEGRSLN